jgi:hypothetical protein
MLKQESKNFNKSYYGDQIKENEICGANAGSMGKVRNVYKTVVRKPE